MATWRSSNAGSPTRCTLTEAEPTWSLPRGMWGSSSTSKDRPWLMPRVTGVWPSCSGISMATANPTSTFATTSSIGPTGFGSIGVSGFRPHRKPPCATNLSRPCLWMRPTLTATDTMTFSSPKCSALVGKTVPASDPIPSMEWCAGLSSARDFAQRSPATPCNGRGVTAPGLRLLRWQA